MELNDYLEQIKACEYSALREEYGIQSNFPVLLKSDFKDIINGFVKSGKWDAKNTEKNRGGSKALLDYKESQSYLDVGTPLNRNLPILTGIDVIDSNQDINTEKVREHKERQLKNYNIYLMVYNSSRPNSLNLLVSILDFIGNYAIDNKIPACFPHSIGSNYDLRDDKSLERIVYYNPE